jgi:release factor glutamine methyltransferase
VIRRLVQQAPAFLKPSGWLMLELDPAQAEPTQALMEAAGFVNVGPRQDLSGQARVVSGCYSGELDAE